VALTYSDWKLYGLVDGRARFEVRSKFERDQIYSHLFFGLQHDTTALVSVLLERMVIISTVLKVSKAKEIRSYFAKFESSDLKQQLCLVHGGKFVFVTFSISLGFFCKAKIISDQNTSDLFYTLFQISILHNQLISHLFAFIKAHYFCTICNFVSSQSKNEFSIY